jgi:hypothetical protein
MEPKSRQPRAWVPDSLLSSGQSEKAVGATIASPFRISRYPYSRFWAVYDGNDLVAVTVYRRGAEEVRRRLQAATAFKQVTDPYSSGVVQTRR